METWKIAKLLLANEDALNDYKTYQNALKKLKACKNYWRIDYSKLDHKQTYNVRSKMIEVKHEIEWAVKKLGPDFAINIRFLDTEIERSRPDPSDYWYIRRNKISKSKATMYRQKMARNNRSCGKSKNR